MNVRKTRKVCCYAQLLIFVISQALNVLCCYVRVERYAVYSAAVTLDCASDIVRVHGEARSNYVKF